MTPEEIAYLYALDGKQYELLKAVREAIAAEREACAKLADAEVIQGYNTARFIAQAIRARK